MRYYLATWFTVIGYLGFEYWALTFRPELSTILKMQNAGFIRETFHVSTEPGSNLSIWLGWWGFGLMVIMNLYSVRKRFSSVLPFGKLGSWLNFHIFCGLCGPSLIFFHCGFKVRGIVGISFWSMVISFTSGIIGRYFYIQLVSRKVDSENLSNQWLQKLDRVLEKASMKADEKVKAFAASQALAYAGGVPRAEDVNPMKAFVSAMMGDIRMYFAEPPAPPGWPANTRICLMHYSINKRKAQFLEPFGRLMGYWHTFHLPFAIFMYVAAVIHITSSLIFLK